MNRATRRRAMLTVAAFCLFSGSSLGQDPRTFIMPEDDGYGVGDCLAGGTGSACGRIVADAWCESKGFAKAKSFGRGDDGDVTGSSRTQAGRANPPTLRLIVITCDD